MSSIRVGRSIVVVFIVAAVAFLAVGCGGGNPAKPDPPDQDKDGVPDTTDQCPTLMGPASNNGCPLPPPPPVTVTKTTIVSYSPADGSTIKYAQYGGSATVVVSYQTVDSVPCLASGLVSCAIEVLLYNEYDQSVGSGIVKPSTDDPNRGTVSVSVSVSESPYWPNGINSFRMQATVNLYDVVTHTWTTPTQESGKWDVTWHWNK